MTATALGFVLLSAFLHALWSTSIKASRDPLAFNLLQALLPLVAVPLLGESLLSTVAYSLFDKVAMASLDEVALGGIPVAIAFYFLLSTGGLLCFLPFALSGLDRQEFARTARSEWKRVVVAYGEPMFVPKSTRGGSGGPPSRVPAGARPPDRRPRPTAGAPPSAQLRQPRRSHARWAAASGSCLPTCSTEGPTPRPSATWSAA